MRSFAIVPPAAVTLKESFAKILPKIRASRHKHTRDVPRPPLPPPSSKGRRPTTSIRTCSLCSILSSIRRQGVLDPVPLSATILSGHGASGNHDAICCYTFLAHQHPRTSACRRRLLAAGQRSKSFQGFRPDANSVERQGDPAFATAFDSCKLVNAGASMTHINRRRVKWFRRRPRVGTKQHFELPLKNVGRIAYDRHGDGAIGISFLQRRGLPRIAANFDERESTNAATTMRTLSFPNLRMLLGRSMGHS
jgi:hypothetical protein